MASIFEATAGNAIGYPTGLGGAVTQATSKATGVTLSKPAGEITTHDASLAGAAEVSFVVTNTFVGINDVPVVAIQSGATTGTYVASVSAVAAGSFNGNHDSGDNRRRRRKQLPDTGGSASDH
jgi:hypothetical protein